jgi:phage gp29-like protein
MAQILDQFGRPIDTGKIKEVQTARLGQLANEFAGHPSRNLTPPKLARILEQAELGDLGAQADLFLDMEEKDAHIYAEMSKRKRALLTVGWDIVPPIGASAAEKTQAERVKELVGQLPNWEDVLLDALDGIGHGFACLEIEWQQLGKKEWIPRAIEHRPQSWFHVKQGAWNELRLRNNTAEGEALAPFGWVAHVHRAKSGYIARAGLHRVLAWPYLFKNYSVRDLAEFLEIYGLPMRLGMYPSGSDNEEKATLMRAVTGIGHNAAGIIPDSMKIEFTEAAKGTHDPFMAMYNTCEALQSKAILGGTLTSQPSSSGGGAYALGNVHNEVRHDLKASDARQLAGTLTRDIVYPIHALNHGAADPRRAPRLAFDVREIDDLKVMSEALPKLVGIGVQVPASYPNLKLGIPLPKEGEAVLTPPAVPIADSMPASAADRRRAAARQDPGQDSAVDEFDLLSDDLASDWERVTDPLLAPIVALAAQCSSLKEFQRRLPEAVKDMDVEQLTEALARGQFAAAVWGRVNPGGGN